MLITLALLITAAVLLAVSRHDAATLRIPDRIVVPGTMAVGAMLLLVTAQTRDWLPLNNALLGAVGSAGFYLLLHLVTRGGIGFGDVKLALLIGLLTGWFSPATAILAPMAAFVGAGIGAIVLIATRQINRKTEIPLAPWMAFGALAALTVTAY